MFTRSEAEENLRTIRSLMERSTIYRAISAPTALAGGLFSIVAYTLFHYVFDDLLTPFGQWFLGIWLVTLVLTLVANTLFIWRGAKLRSEPFISPGMKMALISLLPSMLCAGFLTSVLLYQSLFIDAFLLPPIWMICYGLGLLSTSHFAPRSITFLGWVFLFSGFGAFFYLQYCCQYRGEDTFSNLASASNFTMGATFGFYHLIYAACTWPRKNTTTTPGGEP